MARKCQSVSFPPTAPGGTGSGFPPPAMQTGVPSTRSGALKNEDRRSLPHGRSFLWGLFSSSSSHKEPKKPADGRTKLSKAPPMSASNAAIKTLREPRIGSVSPELYNDPAFSSDPRSHLLSNSHSFLGPAPVPSQTSLKHEQPIDTRSRHSERPKQSSDSPTDSTAPGVTPFSSISAGPSYSVSTPSLSFVQTPSPVTSTPSSSTSHAAVMPSQPLATEPRSRSPQYPATYRPRLHNPDLFTSSDDPPSYDEITSTPIHSEKRGGLRVNSSPPTEAGPSAAALRESPTHSHRTSPYEKRSQSPSHSFSSSNHSALAADPQAPQPPQLPPQEIPQQMYSYQQQQPQRPSNSRYTTPEKSHPEREAPQQPTCRNAPLILRYEPPPEPQPTAKEHRQARAQPKRTRTNQLDPIDELDQTNPLGMRLHHGGPYEAIQKVVKPKSKEQQNRPQRNHDNSSVENPQISTAPASFTPFGASLNLIPGQILPHNFQPYVQPVAQALPLQNQASTRQKPQASSQDPYQTRQYQPADVQLHPLQSHSSSRQVHQAADQHQHQRGGVPFNPYDNPIHHSQSYQPPQSHQPVPVVAVQVVQPAQTVRQSPRPITPVHEENNEDAYGGIADAYGGIEEKVSAPAFMIPRSERRSAPVPPPATNVTPGLNLQRSQTAVTPRHHHVPLGYATPVDFPQPTPYPQPSSYDDHGRSNVSYPQPPPHRTPYGSNSRRLDSVEYEDSRMRQPFVKQYNQPPPQRMPQSIAPQQMPPQPTATPHMVYQQMAPQQRPPVRQPASSIQSSSSAYRNGPPPKHLPSNLVMPTPLQNAHPKTSSIPQPHRIDPRHQPSSQFPARHPSAQPSTTPSNAFGMVMLPSENQKILRKGSSVAGHVPTTGVAFAANIDYVDSAFTRQASVKPKTPLEKQKVPRRVLSKKRGDF